MSLNDIATVNISGDAPALTQVGFGTPLILGYHTRWVDQLVKEYEETSDLASDGFESTDPEYMAFVAIKAQEPSPPKVKIGRLTVPFVQVQHLTPAAGPVEGDVYSYTCYNGAVEEIISYTAEAAPTIQTVVEGLLAAAVVPTTPNLQPSEDNAKLILTSDEGVIWFIKDWTPNLSYVDVTPNPATSVADQLDDIVLEDDDWYALTLTIHAEAIQQAASDWTETQTKIMGLQTSDSAAMNDAVATDIGATLQAATQGRTFCVFQKDDTGDYIAAALLGKCLPFNPGSETWAHKSLSTIVVDSLTPSEKSALRDKNYVTYTRIAGLNLTLDGKVAGGEYIDTVRFRDWMAVRMQERIVRLKASNPKVPFTNAGITAVQTELLSQIEEGAQNGGVSRDVAWTVTVPKAQDVSSADKAARTLNNVKFKFTLAGAIHLTNVTGTASV